MADAATEQGNGLEVTDEDLRPAGESTKDGGTKASPKTEKSGAQSQPNQDGAKEKGPAPWDAKLAEMGLDDPSFSEFIRSEIQPYITQLEQGGGGAIDSLFGGDQESAEVAAEVLNMIINDPEQALQELSDYVAEQRGEDFGEGGEEYDEDYDEYDEYDEYDYEPEDEDPRLSWAEQQMQREQDEQADYEYETALEEIEERVGEEIDRELFTRLVLSSQGDFEQALAAYMPYHQSPEPSEDAPPVLEGGGTPPPAAPTYKSLDDAIGGYVSELGARRG